MFMADTLNLIDNVETAGVVALSMQNARRAQAETAAALEEVKQLKATLAKRLRAEQELRICLADAKARVEAYELKLEKCRQLKANKVCVPCDSYTFLCWCSCQ